MMPFDRIECVTVMKKMQVNLDFERFISSSVRGGDVPPAWDRVPARKSREIILV